MTKKTLSIPAPTGGFSLTAEYPRVFFLVYPRSQSASPLSGVYPNRLGLVVKGQPVDPLYRSDAVVMRFAQEFVSVAYTWPMNGEGQNEGKLIYPLPMYTQAFKIHPDIRAEWLGRQHVAYAKAKDPFTNYVGKSQHTKTTITGAKIERLDPEAHEWDVRLYATQYRFDGQNNLIYNPVKVNKILTLRAVQGFRPNWQIADTDLGRMIDDALHSELLITNIVDLPT